MYLKKLELLGFKSFADKTEFTFPRSVTAIVGPNGCGKSNVVDAFKWIFGEQSARGLRGEEMKDVIFNGTQTRKPTGLAEVTVVFDNSDRSLDIDYGEVAITRRLYRSGESEYLINKQKCRLRDIKELFLDTGLGTSSYSMLEQGKIDVLLQASTLDRRIIFEEAAGISRYRVKKAESLRALQRTEENLARLGDIIDEVEKRMHRVKVQAGKARRYRECFERLRTLRVRAALDDYRVTIAERVDLTARRLLCDHRIARQEDASLRLKEALDRHRGSRRELSEKLSEAREALAGARRRRERTEERIEQDGRRLAELSAERERKVEERAAEAAAREKLHLDIERESAERERAAGEIAGRRGLLEERIAALASRGEELEAISRDMEKLREAIVASLKERSRVGNRLAQVSSELGSLSGRRDRTGQAVRSALARADAEELKARALDEELGALSAELLDLDRSRSELDAAAAALREETAKEEERQAGLLGAIQDRRSRLDVLSSLEAQRDGLGEGTAAALAARTGSPSGEVRGLVADFLRVERRYAKAVEAALGDHAQSLVVETQEGGLEVLAFVKEGSSGRVEVIALDRLEPSPGEGSADGGAPHAALLPGPLPGILAEAGVLGSLSARVETVAGYRPLIERLLWGVILVEDLPTAVALSRNGLRPYRLVTLEGARVEPWGSMASASAPGPGGIISRRSEMAELESELVALERDLAVLRGRRDALGASREDLEGRVRRAGQSREAAALKLGAAETVLAQTRRERDHALREARVGESELAEVAAQEEVREAERRAAEEELEVLDRRREEESRSLLEKEREASRVGEEHRGLGEAVTELRVRLAEAEERGEGLRRTLNQLAEALAEEEKRRQALESRIEELLSRHAETTLDRETSRAELEEIACLDRTLGEKVEAMEGQDRESAELEAAFGAELERLRSRAEEARKDRESVNLREQEGKLRRNSLVEKIADEYGLDLSALAEGRGVEPPESLPEEGPWDRQAAEEECQALREKLRHLGNVNLEALDELKELEERHRFMASQREDLRKAERDLKEIIAEINRTSRELFLKTFEAVQRHFGEIFRMCFGGGMAELVLEEGADVLEAGIEIIARPPGKKLTSLSLMSGGEKTMTTIALLFAIFRSRPSPFCILDEVDAPLDENNVRRFVVILRDFVKSSQFIIITHNKVTMAEADSLFGITMEERGISRRVAVEFESYNPALAATPGDSHLVFPDDPAEQGLPAEKPGDCP